MYRLKNEERWIKQSIESIYDFCDEIVILDDNSTDNTKKICTQFDKVVDIHTKTDSSFDEARDRNFLLNMALKRKPDVLLSLDGDEIFLPDSGKIIREEIDVLHPDAQVFEFQRKARRKEAEKKYKLDTNFYGKIWVGKDDSWYSNNFIRHIVFHAHFIEWLKQRKDVNTILEVGCGTGNYPIRLEWLFENKNYLGTDISESAIEYCKKNSKFEFFAGDFLKMNLGKKFDLVYSHSVIDHVYDIDLFLSKIIKNCKKYAFISSYQGYFPNSKQHEINYHENDGYYLNKLSVSAIRETLLKNGLEENEFSISPFEGGLNDFKVETIIQIRKT